MTDAADLLSDPVVDRGVYSSRWPRVIGMLGIVLGAIMALDKIDDLIIHLTWTEAHWQELLGSELAPIVTAAMPPLAWRVFSSLLEIALGLLLVTGSIKLRRRRRSGVRMCKIWARVAALWVVVAMVWAIWWMRQLAGTMPSLSDTGFEAYAVFGVGFALGLLLIYPLFLLFWFSRPEVRSEVETWAE